MQGPDGWGKHNTSIAIQKATVLILIYLSQVPISEINGSYYAHFGAWP